MSQNTDIKQAADESPEVVATRRCDKKITEIQNQFPDWFELFEETMPDNAPRDELIELMASAPNDFSMGLMYGKFTMRLEIEVITGRPFV